MRDPGKTTPRDTGRDPMRDDLKRSGGMGRWLRIGGLVLLALILVMWFTGGGTDVDEEVDVTPTATLPADAVTDSPAVEEVQSSPPPTRPKRRRRTCHAGSGHDTGDAAGMNDTARAAGRTFLVQRSIIMRDTVKPMSETVVMNPGEAAEAAGF